MQSRKLVDYNEPSKEPTVNGDIFPYGRHKKKEKEQMVQYMDKLRDKKLEVRDVPVVILSPEAILANKKSEEKTEIVPPKPTKKMSKMKYRELERKFNDQLHK